MSINSKLKGQLNKRSTRGKSLLAKGRPLVKEKRMELLEEKTPTKDNR
jgi:hypothetical protein